MRLTQAQSRQIERYLTQLAKTYKRKPYVFHQKFIHGITSDTYYALRRADKAPKEGTQAGRKYDQNRAIVYMTWKLQETVFSASWDGNRIRYVYAASGKHEIPNWDA